MASFDMAGFAQGLARTKLGAPILLMLMLAMIVVPLHPLLLDALFTFNIAIAIVVMLAAIYSERPLDLSVFPTVLLISTLLRLGLNVASTRIVLLEGHTGTGAAGHVIESFGAFVIGGNYAVGFVVFAILVIINFVVVTKGAGRISEVSARFTLDAMPGKQMAIDADLNAGVLSQEEARDRRASVAAEADFYGAMDGASKFVKGDAIAGILILFINLIGGIAIGTIEHGMGFAQAGEYYSLLTIGDGLVAQIPSLLLSSAAAVMVTRTSTASDMGGLIIGQLFQSPQTLYVTAGVMGVLGAMPGMPNVAFLSLAAIAGGGAWYLSKRQESSGEDSDPSTQSEIVPATPEVSWDDVQPADPLELEVGYRLISLVDPDQSGELLGRIKSVRKKRTAELGFLVSPVHIRDALDLEPNHYRIKSHGVTVGEGEVFTNMELAIDSGTTTGRIDGHATTDPVFGLDAVWISPDHREQAQAMGYMVFDACTVIATHLDKVVVDFAHELLGHNEVQQLLDRLGTRAPKLVENLIPDVLPLSAVIRVLQNLLREQVPLLQMQSIVETLAEFAPGSQDPDVLTSQVRVTLGRFIVQQINELRPELAVVVLDPGLDRILLQQVQTSGSHRPALDSETLMRLDKAMGEAAELCNAGIEPTVMLVADTLRGLIVQMARRYEPPPKVLAIGELPDNQKIKSVGRVGAAELIASAGAG